MARVGGLGGVECVADGAEDAAEALEQARLRREEGGLAFAVAGGPGVEEEAGVEAVVGPRGVVAVCDVAGVCVGGESVDVCVGVEAFFSFGKSDGGRVYAQGGGGGAYGVEDG